VHDILASIADLAEPPVVFESETEFVHYLQSFEGLDLSQEQAEALVPPTTMAARQEKEQTVDLDLINSLPFDLDESKLAARDVPVEGKLTPEESKQAWRLLFEAAKVNSDDAKQAFVVDVMTWFIVNSGSARANFSGDFKNAAYGTVPVRTLRVVLDTRVRRFCRANANVAHKILVANQTLAASQRAKLGLPDTCVNYAFDFSDACYPMDEDILRDLKAVRGFKVTSATPYTTESRIAAANYKPAASSLTSAQRAFPSGSGAGSYPID